MIRLLSRYRDLIFLGLLIFMIHIAIKRHKGTPVHQIIDIPAAQEEKPLESPLIGQIDRLVSQLDIALEKTPPETAENDQLKEMRQQLVQLKKQSQLSPAYILLGPIASTGIALKEQKIEKKLITIAQQIGQIIALVLNKDYKDIKRTLSEYIEYNDVLLISSPSSEEIQN